MPEAALLSRLQRFLKPHARGRQQVRRRLGRVLLRQQSVELLLCFQFRRAVGAALHMLFQFMTSVISQLAINMQRDVFSHPFALHSFHLCWVSGLGSWVL